MPHDPAARRFAIGIVLAFLPAAFAGVLLHDFIQDGSRLLKRRGAHLHHADPGGALRSFWWSATRRSRALTMPWAFRCGLAFSIGCCQMLALVPGVSRSGATICGALLLGTDKRSAAEFSFFLALPTMFGAFVYDLYANRNVLSAEDGLIIAVGFVAAFFAALVVVRTLLAFVTRHGFAPFAYWRIAVGSIGLLVIFIGPMLHSGAA